MARDSRTGRFKGVVSTLSYPELSPDMAMKIGSEYSSERVTAKNFEQLAEEAGLARPLVRGRVTDLATTVLAALPRVETAHPAAARVAALIRQRSENLGARLRH